MKEGLDAPGHHGLLYLRFFQGLSKLQSVFISSVNIAYFFSLIASASPAVCLLFPSSLLFSSLFLFLDARCFGLAFQSDPANHQIYIGLVALFGSHK